MKVLNFYNGNDYLINLLDKVSMKYSEYPNRHMHSLSY